MPSSKARSGETGARSDLVLLYTWSLRGQLIRKPAPRKVPERPACLDAARRLELFAFSHFREVAGNVEIALPELDIEHEETLARVA